MKNLIGIFTALILLITANFTYATTPAGRIFLEADETDTLKTQYLVGYMAGYWDQLEVMNPELARCVSSGGEVKMSHLARVINWFLKQNPDWVNQHPSIFISTALKAQFKCDSVVSNSRPPD